MYTPGTILALKEPKSTPETKKGADDAVIFPYDEVEVIGASPIYHSGQSTGEWEGASAQTVIIRPLTEFAGNLDEPMGRLQTLYNVKYEPERVEQEIKVERYDANTRAAGLTPEEAFAGDQPQKKSETRVRTPHSPLQDLAEEVVEPTSPLERVQRERARVAKGGLKNPDA